MIKAILKSKSYFAKVLPQIFLTLIFIFGISFLSFDASGHEAQTNSVVNIEPIYPADFSNNEILMGASHNVFVGKVLEQTGTKERGIGPETQFSVEVIENIKGELKDIVVVNQEGGYRDGVLYVVGEGEKGSSYMLQPGSTYLFATRYNEQENWHTLNSFPTAHKLISSDVSDDAQMKTLATSDSRVQELKEAYKNEILLDADIKNSTTLNSYESVRGKAQKDAEDTTQPTEVKDDSAINNTDVSATPDSEDNVVSPENTEQNSSDTSTESLDISQ